ncbi:MAG: bifunctional 4-hydroxy-2-oxoglutarate aldolase/2-dehydro-3-deoxy-phosphogluconate aldolase, partial [Clostridia bacterium]|nr:bifunctional 4-hydroxy-2-oxoglutarate aldolase/2-dehydro-3-deoxy-phosphogluconate aldolase [Clostridia bacterium]
MSKCLDIIKGEKIIPVIKIDNLGDTLPLMAALKEGGMQLAEITFRTACAAEALALAVKECKDMVVGAGTVINVEQAEIAVELGAAFIVSPGFSAEIAKYCNLVGILYIPGCVNPTDIMAALQQKINVVKFFPAENYGGVKTLKSLSAVFPTVSFVPTG